jgi:hypothetical protein
MKAMAEFIAVEIGVRCKHTLSLNLVITLIISGTTLKAVSQIPNLTILPDRFNEAKIVCHPKGKFLAALFFKEFESEQGRVRYGARLEVWELDKTMYPYRLLFQESEQPGEVVYIGHLIWVGDNLLYTVLTHFQSFKEFIEYANRQVTKDPFKSARIGYYKQHYELRLWFPGTNRAKIVRKGVLGIGGKGRKYFLLSLPIKDQFVLLDPEDEWNKVISGMLRNFEETRHRYLWERIIQICKIERQKVKVIKILHIKGINADPEVIGFSSNGRLLVLRAYFNPQMIKSPSFFSGPLYLLIDLMNGSVSMWKFGNKIDKEIGINFGLLSTNEIIVLHGLGEALNIKYVDWKGNILKEYTITEEQFKKMIGYDTYEQLKNLYGIAAPLYETWTPDGKKLIMQNGGYVWSLDINSLTMKQITKGIWIEKVLQWIGNRYLVIQWYPYIFPEDISHKPSFSLGILKID